MGGDRTPMTATPTPTSGSLRHDADHLRFLAAETHRLLDGARAAAAPDGAFTWLDDLCRPDDSRPRELWITARMTHVFSLGHLLGRDGDAAMADCGLRGLRAVFADRESGGWFPTVGDEGPLDIHKQAYDHVFVVLAASSATIAARPGARELLDEALEVLEHRFWDEEAGALVDVWDRSWSQLEPYRGGNANMHGVEALLAAADATGDSVWARRAARIVHRLILGEARQHAWRVPEHHDAGWRVLPEYNIDQPGHPFRPYGVTPGHGLEWSRMLLHLNCLVPDEAYLEAARALFDRAVSDAWSDDLPGLAYTTDWEGVPVVRERFHWVLCEGIGAAAVLAKVTNDPTYDAWYARWWDLARERFIDLPRGGWVHELDEFGRPSEGTWQGKPDWYHATQATLLPRLPLTASLASAIAVSR
jgi:sulfoquinovose isomerase